MCLYPRFIKNKRYLSYKVSPKDNEYYLADQRKLYVPIGCGKCIECRRQKAQAWRVRLMEEIKANKHAYFVTLTFSEESFKALNHDESKPNNTATLAIRRFLERWRKKHKKSLKHWFITELGQENTERLHLHGLIFSETTLNNDILQLYWKYGRTDIGDYCNERTINYIVKYVTKVDFKHKDYEPVILCSAGIGSNFVESYAAKETYKYRPHESKEYYTLNNGQRVALPIYYRNKFYSQRQRDEMWTDRLNKDEIYVNKIRIRKASSEDGYCNYMKTLKTQQADNENLGYGKLDEWQQKNYTKDFVNAHRL